MTATTIGAQTEPDPVLVALANRNPELDDLRWRVRLPDGSRAYIAGEKVETDDGSLRFVLDDGTVREFPRGDWASATGLPGKVEPVLDQIIRRLHLFGLADDYDVLHQGSWLQAQPEWIEEERRHLAPGSTELADMERIHTLRKMGF